MALTIDPDYAKEVRDLLGNKMFSVYPLQRTLAVILDIREIVSSHRMTRPWSLSLPQVGYTLEKIDVYGVGPDGEEVIVVPKVWWDFSPGSSRPDWLFAGPGNRSEARPQALADS